ncbi:MAG TPA: transposase, partial [Pseudonocardia sp.]|uniref:transposase n=1 Tax=Pseudonocardia sp. TaxID=60912 RepID=UPI002F41411D
MVDAIGYVTRYGIEWRALPVDFPPWTAVYAFSECWSARSLPRRHRWPPMSSGCSPGLHWHGQRRRSGTSTSCRPSTGRRSPTGSTPTATRRPARVAPTGTRGGSRPSIPTAQRRRPGVG